MRVRSFRTAGMVSRGSIKTAGAIAYCHTDR